MADVPKEVSVIKTAIREVDVPFFSDEEILFYLEQNNGNVNDTIYQCLCLKAENTTLTLSGLTTADSSKYFRRLANMYRPSNSGVLST